MECLDLESSNLEQSMIIFLTVNSTTHFSHMGGSFLAMRWLFVANDAEFEDNLEWFHHSYLRKIEITRPTLMPLSCLTTISIENERSKNLSLLTKTFAQYRSRKIFFHCNYEIIIIVNCSNEHHAIIQFDKNKL